jgi:hypothetical protein
MSSQRTIHSARRQRGGALLVALAVTLGLLMIVSATQLQVVTQLARSRTESNYERALQMAEAGANAYLNGLAFGTPAGSVANRELIPPVYSLGSLLTLQQFKDQAADGTIPAANIIYYPPGQTRQGYFAAHVGSATSAFITVVGYGFSNGVVRRVRLSAISFSIFDWAALYGIDPIDSNQDFAWKFTGSASVVGAAGGEGLFVGNNNVTFYDGPVIWAKGCYGPPFNNPDPPVLVSAPNVPPGHVGFGALASPLYRHYVRSLNFPTADKAANEQSGSTSGVAYYKTNNNNTTGIRYLVRSIQTGAIRELPGSYSVISATDYQLDNEFNPSPGTLTSLGMLGNEEFYGLRVYPGNYYFEQVNMQNTDHLYLRTFKDSERATFSGMSPDPRQIVVQGDPPNPNSGQAENQNIRFWIGRTTKSTDPGTTFDVNTVMEYPRYASRFRVYAATRGDIIVRGRNETPPPPFRVNLLCYNQNPGGTYYGSVKFVSSTYLYGSLIGWQVEVAGSTTIEKEATEIGPGDRLTYVVTDWTELP